PWPPADFADLRAQARSFDGIAALTTGRQVIVGDAGQGAVEQLRTGAATPNLFRVLGTRVLVGRDFGEADGTPLPPQPAPPAGTSAVQAPRTPAPPPLTILSYEFWQRRFGGNRAIVGSVVRIGE